MRADVETLQASTATGSSSRRKSVSKSRRWGDWGPLGRHVKVARHDSNWGPGLHVDTYCWLLQALEGCWDHGHSGLPGRGGGPGRRTGASQAVGGSTYVEGRSEHPCPFTTLVWLPRYVYSPMTRFGSCRYPISANSKKKKMGVDRSMY
jgi:hypothetical protein